MQPAGVAQLLGHRGERLVDQLERLLAVHEDRRRHRHRARGVDDVAQLAQQRLEVVRLLVAHDSSGSPGGLALGPALGQPLGDLRRHHPRHVAAEPGDLAHQARRQERVLRAGRDEEGVDARQLLVHLGHLQLVVEVGDRAEALDDRLGAVLLGELDEQALEELDPHVGEVRDLLGEHLLALLEGEQRRRLLRVADDGHDHVVEVARGPLDDVEVTVGDGIERARAEGGGQAGAAPVRAGPDLGRSRPPGAYRRRLPGSRSPGSGADDRRPNATDRPTTCAAPPRSRNDAVAPITAANAPAPSTNHHELAPAREAKFSPRSVTNPRSSGSTSRVTKLLALPARRCHRRARR